MKKLSLIGSRSIISACALAVAQMLVAQNFNPIRHSPASGLSAHPDALLTADIGVTLTGLPDPIVVSNQLTYTLVIQNGGPADAPDVIAIDTLPASVSFVSASPSQGTVSQTSTGLIWDAGLMTNGAGATNSLIVVPIAAGFITNSVSAVVGGNTVIDPNPDNNTAQVVTVVNAIGVTNVSFQILGPIVFDPQTGLFEQSVGVTNLGTSAAPAVRLEVLGLPADVTLYNASGMTNGVPFVEYDSPLGPGSSVAFLLEYYRSSRLLFGSTNFSASVVSPGTPAPPSGTTLQLDRNPFLYDGKLVIEFVTVPGDTYVVQYSADMQTWNTAVPPIVAAGTSTQWIDAGPPKTDSPPGAPGQRFYRVLQLP